MAEFLDMTHVPLKYFGGSFAFSCTQTEYCRLHKGGAAVKPTKKRTINHTRTQCKYIFLIDAFLDMRLTLVGGAY
jgi:hypothetical protein